MNEHDDIPEQWRGNFTLAVFHCGNEPHIAYKRSELFSPDLVLAEVEQFHQSIGGHPGNVPRLQTSVEGLSLAACLRISFQIRIAGIVPTRSALLQLLAPRGTN